MTDYKQNNLPLYAETLSQQLGFPAIRIKTTFDLFESGATVPFLARYRKEQTGSLDEAQLLTLKDKWEFFKELDDRKSTILRRIDYQKALNDELKNKIIACIDRNLLEDYYLPYKPQRKTRATTAKEAGLEPLARILEKQEGSQKALDLAITYINSELGFDTPEKVIAGALDILSEEVSQMLDYRPTIRSYEENMAVLVSEVKEKFKEQKTKYNNYYSFQEKVKDVPAHRVLAIRRGEKENILRSFIQMNDEKHIEFLKSKIIKPNSIFESELSSMCIDSYHRLLKPAIEVELKNDLKERADQESIKVFSKNLKDILMSPPAREKVIMGVDPGFKSGTKLAVIDKTGKFLEHRTIYPLPPQEEKEASKTIFLAMVESFEVEIVAVGNGTASREINDFFTECFADLSKKPIVLTVSEAGASVYSASSIAREEFPELDVTIRGAISIARRVQDPLAELVKIDPKSMGVGQYQHDVKPTVLTTKLEQVVESCVSSVGVDINTASESLLSYVAGIPKSLAKSIVDHRNQYGSFSNRASLVKVPKFGPKAFEQSAGFLRVFSSDNVLDGTAVHPERYEFLMQVCEKENTRIEELIGNTQKIETIPWKNYVSDTLGMPTLLDIQEELKKPNRDPRKTFVYANFNPNIRKISDLTENMWLEGVVSNVTDFGVFVDIGVHQDGLIHVSEMSQRFIKDVKNFASAGDLVRVRVLSADPESKRISLSMKEIGSASPVSENHPKRPFGKFNKPTQNYSSNSKSNQPPKKEKKHATIDQLQSKFQNPGTEKKNNTKLKFSIKSIMKSGR